MGWVQPGTSRGTLRQMIGWRNTVPSRMLRMVPLGERHIFCRLNSFTRPSSGVMVAHLTPTRYLLMALAASTVTWSAVASRRSTPRRSEEHTSELQSLMRISYAVFCLKKNTNTHIQQYKTNDVL